MPGAGGGSRGVCDTGASLVMMSSGFPKSQDLRLLAGPTSLQPAAIPGGDSCRVLGALMNHVLQVRGGVCAPGGLLASHFPMASRMEKLPCVLLPPL